MSPYLSLESDSWAIGPADCPRRSAVRARGWGNMKQAVRVGAALVATFLVAVVLTGTAGAGQESDANATGTGKGVSDVYLVVLDEAPVAAYQGGVAGFPATKPAPGGKLDKTAPNVVRYAGHLRARRHAEQGAGGPAASLAGRRLGGARLPVPAGHRQHPNVPRSQRGRWHLEPARRTAPRGRGRHHRGRGHGHLARAPELRRHRLWSRARWLAWRVRVRGAVGAERLHRQADRCPVFREGLRPLRRCTGGRLPVGARS